MGNLSTDTILPDYKRSVNSFRSHIKNSCVVFDRGLQTPRNNNREFKKTTTATATGTSLNKRFNEQNNSCARAL